MNLTLYRTCRKHRRELAEQWARLRRTIRQFRQNGDYAAAAFLRSTLVLTARTWAGYRRAA